MPDLPHDDRKFPVEHADPTINDFITLKIPQMDFFNKSFPAHLRFLNQYKIIHNARFRMERDPVLLQNNSYSLCYRCVSKTYCSTRATLHLQSNHEGLRLIVPQTLPAHCAGCLEITRYCPENRVYHVQEIANEITDMFNNPSYSPTDTQIRQFLKAMNVGLVYSQEEATIISIVKRNVTRNRKQEIDVVSLLKKQFCFNGSASFLRSIDTTMNMEIYSVSGIDAMMKQAKIFCIDSTFKILKNVKFFKNRPYQLITVMFLDEASKVYVPGYHAVLYSKKKEDYLNFFKQVAPFMENAEMINVDFESNLSESLIDVGFDKSIIKGCLFHYRQAVNRMFAKLISEPTPLDMAVRDVVMVLPFFGIADFRYMIEVLSKIQDHKGIASFTNYVKVYWGPRYDLVQKVDQSIEILTNNALESFHGEISRRISQRLSHTMVDAMRIIYDIDQERYRDAVARSSQQNPIVRKPRFEIFVPRYLGSLKVIMNSKKSLCILVKNICKTPQTEYTNPMNPEDHDENYIDLGVSDESLFSGTYYDEFDDFKGLDYNNDENITKVLVDYIPFEDMMALSENIPIKKIEKPHRYNIIIPLIDWPTSSSDDDDFWSSDGECKVIL